MRSLLDETTVGPYLIGRNVIPPGPVRARTLAGGVSNVVLLVEAGGTWGDESGRTRVVLKQARDRLRVADDWRADPARAQSEAAALRVLHALDPDTVPAVLDDDPVARTLTVAAAPPTWVTWKDRLLAGDADPAVAGRLGAVLRRWHTATGGDRPLPEPLEGTDGFRQLRLDPYFGTAARRRPDLAPAVERRVAELAARRTCLVSGDLSPKNVLVGDGDLWVVDLEVAHRGDPAFDVAFLVTHLLLKAVHLAGQTQQAEHGGDRPAADGLRRCLRAFVDAYGPGS
ncbi:MAG TPA: aminoglycoside phosphotransferase family protein, partial [Acidimicrobiales bacterium]